MSSSCPCQPCQSERQTPVAVTRRTTPSSGQVGGATSRTVAGTPNSETTTARMTLILTDVERARVRVRGAASAPAATSSCVPGHRHPPQRCGQGVGVEHDEVRGRAHRHGQTAAVDGRLQRDPAVDRLLGVPRRTTVAGPADRGIDGDPRVEGRDGGVGPEREPDAGAVQRAEGERAVGPTGPVAVGDVPVVHGVLGLHAGDHAERREPLDVLPGHQLGVLDRPRGAGRREGVEGQGVRCVADGVDRAAQAVAGGVRHEGRESRRRHREDAVGVRAGHALVRVVAVGGAGVEGAVRDDLERTLRDEAGDRVAGVQVLADHAVEELLPDARPHAQPRGARGDAATPDGDVVGELQVHHPDDPARGGGGAGVVDELVGDVVRDVVDDRLQREPLGLAQEAGGVRTDAEEPQPRRRGPGAVQVPRDQDDGQVADGGVEERGRRHVGPEPVAEPEADQGRPRRRRRRGAFSDERDGVRGGGRAGDVEAPARERPLRQVHVRVPEAGHDPPAVEPHLVGAIGELGADRRHPTVAEQDVDGCVAVHQASTAQQDVGGGRYGPHVSTL